MDRGTHPADAEAGKTINRKRTGVFRRVLIPWLLVLSIAIGVGSGLFISRILDVPSIYTLEDYTPGLISTLYSEEGATLAEFASEKRIILDYKEIPKVVKDAVVAAEDSHFYQHSGIDPFGLARALIQDIRHGRYVQGGSTLTQQLAKLLFLSPEKSIERKIKEAVLAIQIEQNYTKDEIMGLYCNQICFDHAVYGIEMASRFYFNKPAAELTLHEAALLLGIPRRPTAYSPINNPERAVRRRNWVIDRMAEEKMLSREKAEEEKNEPLELSVNNGNADIAPHFVEEARKILQQRYGNSYMEKGLRVHTTLSDRMQRAANRAVRDGLLHLSRLRGFTKEQKNIRDLDCENEDDYVSLSWNRGIAPDGVYEGVVMSVDETLVTIRIATHQATLKSKGIRWTGRSNPARIFSPGDVALFRVTNMESETGVIDVELEQEPEMEAALVAIENATGRVKAMVGGYSFQRSNFNCAVQAPRQPGSAFKPILLAAALDNGFTLADTIFDEPTKFPDPHTGKVYAPKNYYRQHYGLTTLRETIERSINVSSVKLNDMLGPDVLSEYARRLGITTPVPPYLSMALGAAEVTLIELTSVYSVFPNLGVRVEPSIIRSITDRDGNVEEEFRPSAHEALNPVTAYLVVSALEGVIERGTGKPARKRVPGVRGGKTGTTDDYTDAWFVGFTPELTVGVWVGFSKEKRSLGSKMSGSAAALPIWAAFLEGVLDPEKAAETKFEVPPGVVFVPVDRTTGLRATTGSACSDILLEAFRAGSEPTRVCSPREHEIISRPWQEQKLILGYF